MPLHFNLEIPILIILICVLLLSSALGCSRCLNSVVSGLGTFLSASHELGYIIEYNKKISIFNKK